MILVYKCTVGRKEIIFSDDATYGEREKCIIEVVKYMLGRGLSTFKVETSGNKTLISVV